MVCASDVYYVVTICKITDQVTRLIWLWMKSFSILIQEQQCKGLQLDVQDFPKTILIESLQSFNVLSIYGSGLRGVHNIENMKNKSI